MNNLCGKTAFKSALFLMLLLFATSCEETVDEGYIKGTWTSSVVYNGSTKNAYMKYTSAGTYLLSVEIKEDSLVRLYSGYYTTDVDRLFLYDTELQMQNFNQSAEYIMKVYDDWVEFSQIADLDSLRKVYYSSDIWLKTELY